MEGISLDHEIFACIEVLSRFGESLGREFSQARLPRSVLGITGEVVPFVRIGLEVVEFFSILSIPGLYFFRFLGVVGRTERHQLRLSTT